MSVSLEPPVQLSFHRPFTQLVKEMLVVTNNNLEPVAFKVKTTAPKQYCVRPNSGRIEPGQSVEVQVILQSMKEDPPPDFKCKDKFLVQSVAISSEHETQSLTELWAYVERNAKETIKESKIRCVYLPPIGSSNAGNLPITTSSSVSQPAASSQPYVAPTASNGSESYENTHIPDQPPYSSEDPTALTVNENSNLLQDEYQPTPDNVTNGNNSALPATPFLVGTFPRDVKGASTSSLNSDVSEDETTQLRRQLSEAQEEIKRLNHTVESYKQELSTAQVRQRKSEEAVEKATRNTAVSAGYATRTQDKIPEGYYPLEVVFGAAICAFLIGIIFF